MIDRSVFSVGLAMIGLQARHKLAEAEAEAFFLALQNETNPAEWQAFVGVAVARFGWRFLPGVAELVAALREFRGEPAILPEACVAYERVIDSSDYTAEGGASWNFRAVRDRCGDAAAEAFLAAGGTHAFATTWDEAKRRERFVLAYTQAVRERSGSRLLPEGSEARALLPAAERIDPGVAAAIVEKIAGRFEMEPKPKGPRLVVLDEARVAWLKAQAAEYDEAKARETVGAGAPNREG